MGTYSMIARASYSSLTGTSNTATFSKTSSGLQVGSAPPPPAAVSYTVSTTPQGRAVTVDGSNYTAPANFNWTAGSTHTIATSSPQAGAAGTQYVFSSWSDGGAQSHTITAPSSSTTYTANFQTQYRLTTAAATGGSIAPATGYFNAGAQVQVSATPSSGYAFTGFSGALSGTTNPQVLALNAPASVTANFAASTPPATVAYTVSTAPQGRAITVDGSNYTAPANFNWTAGSTHTIATSSPQAGAAGTQYAFSSWSDGGAQSHTITAPSTSTTYTANFQTKYQLTTAATTGGSITPASGYFNAGAQVQVSATASSGYTFAGFSGALSGTTNPQVLALNAPASVTASFSANSTPGGGNGATLLFKSGFANLTLNPPFTCGSDECFQTITGSDSTSGFTWPPNIWGSASTWTNGTYLQMLAGTTGTTLNTSNIYNYVNNQLQSVTGPNGTSTTALYMEDLGSAYKGDTGRQDPFVITPDVSQPQGDLYIREWIQLQPNLTSQLVPGQMPDGSWGDWRALAEWKTGGLAMEGTTGCVPGGPTWGGDYRVIIFVQMDSSRNLYWNVQGDNNADGGLPFTVFWNQENHTVPVPVGQWFKFEWFWHRSSGSDGRVWVAVNGQVIADHHGSIVNSYCPAINRIFPITDYTGGYFPAYQWLNSIELWNTFPADATAH